MKILFLADHKARFLSVKLSVMTAAVLAVLLMAISAGIGYMTHRYAGQSKPGAGEVVISSEAVTLWQQKINGQQQQIDEYKQKNQQYIDALTLRLGQLQASIFRLNALGQRLTGVAGLDQGEFDFQVKPAVGGPDESLGQQSYELADLAALLARIEEQSASDEQQLKLLDELIINQKFQRESFVAGRPIRKGWMSSPYGYRSDPFNGKKTLHKGVDFAGKDGSEIIAVAGGVVTYAGKRSGYGLLVEVSHGSGLVTKYAHCKEISVRVGEVVQKGQTVAAMGSTGRSTGPHVHFELSKYGKTVDPAKFIHRASL